MNAATHDRRARFDTWGAFADLVERNNGIFGGCWCLGFHLQDRRRPTVARPRRIASNPIVLMRRPSSIECGAAQRWAQYGSRDELPGIEHRREYDKQSPPRPDWRITCIYVDRQHRSQGIARAALEGALDQIALRGGGLGEGIAEGTRDAKPRACSAEPSSCSRSTASSADARWESTPGS